MRVLYDNKLETATNLAMTNLDSDTYVENLYHPYLELAAVCLTSDSVITGNWSDGQSFNCISIAYHNSDFVTLAFYDLYGVEISSMPLALQRYDNCYYFETVSGVYGFRLEFTGIEKLAIGYVFFGNYLELSRFDAGASFPYDLRSTVNRTSGGQTYGNFARQLRGANVSWNRMEASERALINEYLSLVQTCKPHMIDMFHLAHDIEPPMYCTVDSSSDYKRQIDESTFIFNVSIKYKESR